MSPRMRGRLVMLLVVALFAAPMLAALLLNSAGWHPQRTRNHGTLIEPPRDVSAAPVTLADGTRLVWKNPQWQWTLLALPGAHCADACRAKLDEALRMRLTLGRNAERLRIVYLGPALGADFVAARAPLIAAHDDADTFADFHAYGDDALALALVDPNGQLMMSYAEGYVGLGVRDDLQRVFH